MEQHWWNGRRVNFWNGIQWRRGAPPITSQFNKLTSFLQFNQTNAATALFDGWRKRSSRRREEEMVCFACGASYAANAHLPQPNPFIHKLKFIHSFVGFGLHLASQLNQFHSTKPTTPFKKLNEIVLFVGELMSLISFIIITVIRCWFILGW